MSSAHTPTPIPTELQAARLRLGISRPYISSVLWSVVPVKAPGLGTLGVDKYGRLYYDPDVLRRWTPAEREAVLYHEINHLLRGHAERLDPISPCATCANLAGDLEINDDLRTEGMTLPDGGLYADSPKIHLPPRLTAEEYLGLLPAHHSEGSPAAPEPPSGNGPKPHGTAVGESRSPKPDCHTADGPGSDSPASTGEDDDGGNGNECPDDDDKGEPPAPGHGPGSHTCGSGATGTPEPWEAPPPGTTNADGTEAPDGMGPAELETVRRATAERIREECSHGRDTIPRGLRRWAEGYLNPTVNWRKALRSAIRTAVSRAAGMDDYSWSRPARHQLPGAILPALYRPVPTVAVIVDTSGSMGTEELKKALAEVHGVLKTVGTPIEVLTVDAAVNGRRRVTRAASVDLTGGGGTDMRVGLEALKGPTRPDIAVVITDGYTPWPERPLPFHVVACVVGDGGDPPSWIRAVKVE
jgi:predicted metal-dependent peptidase